MKKYIVTLLFAISSFGIPGVLQAKTTHATSLTQQEVNNMNQRVAQIKKMDFKQLNSTQKAALKKELRTMESRIKTSSPGGIYLSTGALLLIIILLIIFL
jgi:hypothetical protein